MMKRSLMIFVLAAFVALAGCTATSADTTDSDNSGFDATVTENDGLSIELFSAKDTYRVGERAQFRINAKNTGEGDAVVHEITLTRANWISPAEARVLNDLFAERAEDFIESRLDAVDGGVGFDVIKALRVATKEGQESLKKILDDLLADHTFESLDVVMLDRVDRSNNLNGGQNTWTASPTVSASIPSGSEERYRVGAKVVYNYETRARTTTTIMPYDQYTRESPEPTQAQTDTSAGPIEVNAELPQEMPAEEDTLQVPITIRNIGDGRIEDEELDRIIVQTESDYATVERCTPGMDGYNIEVGDLINIYKLIADDNWLEADEVELTAARLLAQLTPGLEPGNDLTEVLSDLFLNLGFSAVGRDVTIFGEEHTFSCELDVETADINNVERDIVLKTYLNYDYVERKGIDVDVQGR